MLRWSYTERCYLGSFDLDTCTEHFFLVQSTNNLTNTKVSLMNVKMVLNWKTYTLDHLTQTLALGVSSLYNPLTIEQILRWVWQMWRRSYTERCYVGSFDSNTCTECFFLVQATERHSSWTQLRSKEVQSFYKKISKNVNNKNLQKRNSVQDNSESLTTWYCKVPCVAGQLNFIIILCWSNTKADFWQS